MTAETLNPAAPEPAAPANDAPPHPFVEFWRSFRRNKGALLGLAVITVISFVAIFADVLAPHNPNRQFTQPGSDRLLNLVPPAWVDDRIETTTLTLSVLGDADGPRVVAGLSRGTPGEEMAVNPVRLYRGRLNPGRMSFENPTLLDGAPGQVRIEDNQLVYDPGAGFPDLADGEQREVAIQVTVNDNQGGDPRFLLGTDELGRDMLSRLIKGAQLSMLIGCIVVTLSLAAGVILGLIAGYFQGILGILIMRLMDLMLALPALLLAIVIVAVLGPSLTNAILAIAIVVLPHYVRLTRAAVLSQLNRDYVTASRLAGASTLRLMFVTILPNCVAPLIVQATLGFSSAILDAAALGFLGLGAQPPTAEWGTMLSNALEFIRRAWWVVTLPGVAILITVLAFNLLGDGLRDALDPKLKR